MKRKKLSLLALGLLATGGLVVAHPAAYFMPVLSNPDSDFASGTSSVPPSQEKPDFSRNEEGEQKESSEAGLADPATPYGHSAVPASYGLPPVSPYSAARPAVTETTPASATAPAASSPYHQSASYLPGAKEEAAPAAQQPAAGQPAAGQPAGTVGAPPANAAQCATGCCEEPCGPPGRTWIRGEYLLWWVRGNELPPLVTTSPTGTARSAAGILGEPDTTVLFGGGEVDDDARSGLRLGLGHWLDDAQTFGIEGSIFFLEDESTSFFAESTGDPIIARPFFDLEQGVENALLVAFPGVVAGDISIRTNSELWGGDLYFRKNLCCGCCYRIDALAGYRFLSLEEDLLIRETEISTNPASSVPLGTRIDLTDRFTTDNEFHGGELGLAAEFRRGSWYVDVIAKLGIGGTRRQVAIRGSQTVNVPGETPFSRDFGFLTQASNIGSYKDNEFSLVPELGINVGYQLSEGLRAYVGYTFIYWTDVVRTGDAVDLTINRTQIRGPLVGEPRPSFAFNDSDLWIQGVNFGLELRF